MWSNFSEDLKNLNKVVWMLAKLGVITPYEAEMMGETFLGGKYVE